MCGFLNITEFLVITDITDFSCFYRFSTLFEDEVGGVRIIKNRYFVPAKTRLGVPPKKHIKKNENFWKMYSNCLHSVYARKRLHTKRISNSPSNLFLHMSKPYILHYTLHFVYSYTEANKDYTLVNFVVVYSHWKYRRFMHNNNKQKQNAFKQVCQQEVVSVL